MESLQEKERDKEKEQVEAVKPGPRWQFRTITDQSNGVNTSTCLGPAYMFPIKAGRHGDIVYDCSIGKLYAPRLLAALTGTKQHANPFVFTTTSPLLALQHALDKTKKYQTNARILCIDTWRAKTVDGDDVDLYSAVDVMNELQMDDKQDWHTGVVRNFRDVYLTTSKITLGEGCSIVSLQRLKELGIFDLFPDQLRYAHPPRARAPGARIPKKPRGAGLETPVKDLRAWRYKDERDLSEQQISLAAKIALAFKSVLGGDNESVPMHVFAHLLALLSQDPEGEKFTSWVAQNTVPNTASVLEAAPSEKYPLPETELFPELFEILRSRSITAVAVESMDCHIPFEAILADISAYQMFWRTQSRERTKQKEIYVREQDEKRAAKSKPKLGLVSGAADKAGNDTEQDDGDEVVQDFASWADQSGGEEESDSDSNAHSIDDGNKGKKRTASEASLDSEKSESMSINGEETETDIQGEGREVDLSPILG